MQLDGVRACLDGVSGAMRRAMAARGPWVGGGGEGRAPQRASSEAVS